MFSCVWLHFKNFSENYFLVFGKEEGKDKPRKTRTKPRKKKSSTIDARLAMASSTRGEIAIDARLGSTTRCFASYNPTTAPSIAIDSAISRSVDRDRRRSQTGLELEVCQRSLNWTGARSSSSRALALSLSLSLQNSFEVKIGTEIHFCRQSLFFFWVNGNQFPENSIFQTNQTPAFSEKYFRKWFSPKTNTPFVTPILPSYCAF